MDIAKELERMDNLHVLRADCCQAAIHDRHRWTLAMIYRAQEMNLVNRPCALVSFDSHADSLEPIAAVRIDELCRNGFDGKDVVSLCSDDLSTNNDDWIRAAMRLGLVSDAVVFGFHDKLERVQFDDRHGNKHRLWTCTMPGSALDWQGVLRDHFKRDELGAQPIWDILDWHNDLGTLGFRGSEDKLFLTIDLDCFRIKWREYTIPCKLWCQILNSELHSSLFTIQDLTPIFAYLGNDEEMRAEVHVGAHGNMLAVEFFPADKGNSWNLKPKNDSWGYILEQIGKALPQPMGTSQILLDGLVHVISDDGIIVIKRNEKRFWTRSLAREDADATLCKAMLKDGRNS